MEEEYVLVKKNIAQCVVFQLILALLVITYKYFISFKKCLQEENERLCDKLVKDLDGILRYPISHQLYKDPVVSRFGHSFEREYIEKWLLEHRRCPLTNQYMTIAHLSPNRALADVVEAFRAHQL